MQRNQTHAHLNPSSPIELIKQTAYHEAGHAVAIYLRNKQQQLPPVFFEIKFLIHGPIGANHNYLANVEGGRLIEHLPSSLAYLTKFEQHAYHSACEADIINLLIGPLTEAKYVSLRDDEVFNQHLLNVQRLGAYGGTSDLNIIDTYLEWLAENPQQRIEKIEQLFTKAFQFIDNRHHWKIIKAVANYLIHNTHSTIPCEDIIEVIESASNSEASAYLARSRRILLAEGLRNL